jgi:hypothetical protein
MKIFYYSLPVVFLFLIGCSSTYKVTDFSTKEIFQNNFNNSAKDTRVKVTLINDSSFVVSEGTEIKNDDLHLNYYPNYYPKKLRVKNENIQLSEVKQASYINHWKGILPGSYAGLFIGSIVGSITGAYIMNLKTGGNHPERDYGTGAVVGGFSGIIMGAIVGAIIGWDNIYQFKP